MMNFHSITNIKTNSQTETHLKTALILEYARTISDNWTNKYKTYNMVFDLIRYSTLKPWILDDQMVQHVKL